MTPAGSKTGFHRRLAVAGALLSAGFFTVGTLNPATWLMQGFETAIDQSTVTAATRVATASSRWTEPVAGTEDFWLGSAERTAQHPDFVKATHWRPAISLGDTFKFGSGSNVREFVVINVSPIARDGATATRGAYLVTSHARNTAEFEVLKLVIDRDTTWPAEMTPGRRAQAL